MNENNELIHKPEFFQRGIERIRTAFTQQHRFALMCTEENQNIANGRKLSGLLSLMKICLLSILAKTGRDEVGADFDRITGGR